ncbi:MAG: sigma-54 dependent transcriptional regulator [Thermodesulfobacteriota bacterium]
MATILIVDDEPSMREFLTILLEKKGHRALCASRAGEALELLAAEHPQLVISDIRMPEMTGLELLNAAHAIDPAIPFLMITAYASPEDAVAAMKGGAYDYITKPFKVEEIVRIVNAALAAPPPAATAAAGTPSCAGIIGQSSPMRQIFEIIARIAPTQANVLIYGESGTGKELVARAVHQHSKVAARPFVPIICSAIPEGLFESELFGHVKGSFTGATASKPGLLALANSGSAFLDEIGELTPLIQTKLLRVLQEREFMPVGATEPVKIDVRIISATNKDLEQEVIAGRFREDLFYRLAVVPIRVPPLRERKEDIPLLVDFFLKKYSTAFGKEINGLSSYAMEVLLDYDFPGNVRELENIIERGVAMASSSLILPESLTLAAHRRGRKPAGGQPFPAAGDLDVFDRMQDLGMEEYIAGIERDLIRMALEKSGGSKMRAAELLRVSFRSLRYKIQKYGMDG